MEAKHTSMERSSSWAAAVEPTATATAAEAATWPCLFLGSSFLFTGRLIKSGAATGWTNSTGKSPARPCTAPNFQPWGSTNESCKKAYYIIKGHIIPKKEQENVFHNYWVQRGRQKDDKEPKDEQHSMETHQSQMCLFSSPREAWLSFSLCSHSSGLQNSHKELDIN